MDHTRSEQVFARAIKVLPGGVNSPVRAFKAVGGNPRFIKEARGAALVDIDGNVYLDYIGSWGPMILGHAHPDVVGAIEQAVKRGTSYGAPTEVEVEIAELITKAVPSVEMMRFTSSGTEAVMGALRVARGFTGRDLVVKFSGCYHGGADYLLVSAGSGAATLGTPDSAGVPQAIASTTLVLPFNNIAALESCFSMHGKNIAALIVEPVVGNMGCVPPEPGYLDALRAITEKHGTLLVFDEVMTGFRLAFGGAQEYFKIKPDLTCFGKIIGGGMPVGAYGGRRDVMQKVAPLGPVYQAGTLSGNPVAMAAGLTTLRKLQHSKAYVELEALGAQLEAGLNKVAKARGVACRIQRVGSMITLFFSDKAVKHWDDAKQCDTQRFKSFHGALLEAGVYWPPSQYEAAFISLAHDPAAIDKTIEAADRALAF